MLSKAEMRKVAGGKSVVCPEGLCFNEVLQMCDWVENGNCATEEHGCRNGSHTCKASENSSLTGVCAPEKSCKCFVTTGGFGYYTTSDCAI
jgi:hypothetical protein